MLMNTYNRIGVEFEKGKGSFLYDTEGNKYLDFVSGIAVNSLGHCHPTLVQTIQAQSQKLWHTSNLYHIKEQQQLGNKLIELSGMSNVFFCNSGTEGMEGALKIAKKYGKTHRGIEEGQIVAMANSFHGRSIGALSVTGRSKYRESFTPLLPGVLFAEFNNLEDVKGKVTEKTVAIVLELIQGEGGINPATIEFIEGLQQICDKNDILLIIDEVQTGIGRTGTMFCFQQYNIQPDVVTLAKGLGGGFPIGAVLGSKKVKDVLQPGDHASTFGGNALACAVANSVLDVIEQEEIIQNVNNISKLVFEKFNEWKTCYKGVKGIRGKGLLLGMEIDYPIADVMKIAKDKGLLVLSAGEGILRMLPPLNVTQEEMEAGLQKLEEVFVMMEQCK